MPGVLGGEARIPGLVFSHISQPAEALAEKSVGLPGHAQLTAMRYLPLLIVLSACTATQEEVAPIEVVQPGEERIPSFQFHPKAWETAGSSLQTKLQLDQPFESDRDIELSFRYSGQGEVHLPQGTMSATPNEPMVVEFQSVPGQDGEGLIEVIYTSETLGDVVVATLPVQHTTKIVKAIDFHPLTAGAFDARYEAIFVVVVHLASPTGEHAEAMRAARDVDFRASLESQIAFAPEVEVDFNVSSQFLPDGSRSVDSLAAIIRVAQRSTAPMRRPFVKLEVEVAGDRSVEYLPLDF